MRYVLFFLTTTLPLQSFAQAPAKFSDVVGIFLSIIDGIVPIIFGLAFLVVVWGITKAWIIGGGDERSVESGKNIVTVGIIALTVMFSIWGILSILRRTVFGV